VTVDERDLRVDIYSNEVEWSMRITHIPTGTVVAMDAPADKHTSRHKTKDALIAKLAALLEAR
jgi:protein subunit release factor A